jgi:succinate-semialdehyde dehydrogenase/glutarate-semialdehyde dehydrogenase
MAGNTGVLKHASNVQGCALLSKTLSLKQVFQRHVMNLNVDSKDVKKLIEDKNIAAITLTGSDAAGRSIASIAGQNLKKR